MKVGFVAGAWDLLHAGHINLFKQAKKHCDNLLVAIQVNPNLERKEKNKPFESLTERCFKLNSCKYVDRIIVYETEEELKLIAQIIKIDVRFLGSDYSDSKSIKPITDMGIPIEYINSLDIHTSDIRKRL